MCEEMLVIPVLYYYHAAIELASPYVMAGTAGAAAACL